MVNYPEENGNVGEKDDDEADEVYTQKDGDGKLPGRHGG